VQDLEAAKSVIELRMDNLNITDREVFLDEKNLRIVVRSPWKSNDTTNDADAALKELGDMYLLTFKEPDGTVVIEGKDVADAYHTLSQDTNEWIVVLKLTSEGSDKFALATERLKGQNISINVDDMQISNPQVQSAILGGEATITGMKNRDEAKKLAENIKAGSLPFALESISSNQISAALGSNALEIMINAGIVAFLIMCMFMLFYYRLPGFVAIIALLGQTAGQLLAISVPQFTLTLPGIAAIILSIGMGVDANIIISERIKEELKSGNPLKVAIRNGFERALAPVIDGNITVAISAIALIIFGSSSFTSFGYLLLTGVIFNAIFGVVATRLLTGSLSQYPKLSKEWLYGGKKVKK